MFHLFACALAVSRQSTQPVYAQLPSPLPLASQDPDEEADILAEKVAHYAPDAGPALVTALSHCGFSIIGKDGKVLVPPSKDKGNGMALVDSEVLNILNAGPHAPMFPFSDVSDVLCTKDPGSVNAVHQAIVDSWRQAMKSKVPETSFLAHFLNDLSMYGARGWSINGDTKVNGMMAAQSSNQFGNSPLGGGAQGTDAIAALTQWASQQMASMSQTMASAAGNPQAMQQAMQSMGPTSEIMAQAQQAKLEAMGIKSGGVDPQALQPQRLYGDEPLSMLQYVLLFRRIYGEGFVKASSSALSANTAGQAAPPDYTGTVMDGGAVAISTFMNQAFWQQLQAEGFNEGMDKVNTVGAYAKVILTYLFLEVKLDPDQPKLTRKKTTQPGDPQKLTTSVNIFMNPTAGNGGGANKGMRGVSWMMGQDISLPDNGPVSNAMVTWDLWEDAALLDKAAQFVDPAGAGAGTIKLSSRTDSNGEAKIGIQTTPQKADLPPNVVSFPREATLIMKIDLKSSNFYQDLIDALSLVTNVATGNAKGILKSTLPDLLTRTSLLSTYGRIVKITDWTMPLEEGTFTLTVSGSASETEKGGTRSWTVKRSVHGHVYSLLKGFAKAAALTMHGQGPYGFAVDSLHDASIDDQVQIHLTYSEGCQDPERLHRMDTYVEGPVASIGSPYSLGGGEMTAKLTNQGGKDVWQIDGASGFSFPCRYRNIVTDYPTDEGITYMDIPIKWTETFPATYNGTIKGHGSQVMDVSLGGVKGKVNCEMQWEIHPTASAGSK